MSTTKKPVKSTEDLQASLQNLIAQGKKDGMIRDSDLNALLEKMSLSPEQIVSRAAADYRTTAETAWAAFRRFAEDLRQKGYLYTEEVL